MTLQTDRNNSKTIKDLDSAEIALISTIEVRMTGSDGCILCGLCCELCPWDAPLLQNRELIIRQDRCRGCGVCVAACPMRAINMKVYETEALLELIRHVLSGEEESRYPDTVFGILKDVEDALLRLESLVIHRAANNDVEDTLHTLKRIIDRIFRTQTRMKKEVAQIS